MPNIRYAGNLQKIMQCSIAHLLNNASQYRVQCTTAHLKCNTLQCNAMQNTQCIAPLPTSSTMSCNILQRKTQCNPLQHNEMQKPVQCRSPNAMPEHQCNAGAPVQCTRTAHLAETGGADQHSPGAGGGAGVEHSALQCNNVIVNSDAIVFTIMQ